MDQIYDQLCTDVEKPTAREDQKQVPAKAH